MKSWRRATVAGLGVVGVVVLLGSSLVLGAPDSGPKRETSVPRAATFVEGHGPARVDPSRTAAARAIGCPRLGAAKHRVCFLGPRRVRGGRRVRFVAVGVRARRVDLRLRPARVPQRSCKRACDGMLLRGFRVRNGGAQLRFSWPTSYGRCVKRCRNRLTATYRFARWRRGQRVRVELLTSPRRPRRAQRLALTRVRIRSGGREPRSFRPLSLPQTSTGPPSP